MNLPLSSEYQLKLNRLPLLIICLALLVVPGAYGFSLNDLKSGVERAQKEAQAAQEKIRAEQAKIDAEAARVKAQQEAAAQQVQQTQQRVRQIPLVKNLRAISPEEEQSIGREVSGSILGAARLVADPALQRYINLVGRWVANQSPRLARPWFFGVIESEAVNAFAAPGGYILVTKGLYRRLNSEAQLAGILAHEIGHVVAEHQIKILKQSQLLEAGSTAVAQLSPEKNVQQWLGSGAELMARRLDQGAEFEADRMGIALAARAGYEPFGLIEVLDDLSRINPNDNALQLLYQTHPSAPQRLEALSRVSGNRLDQVNEGKTLAADFYRLP